MATPRRQPRPATDSEALRMKLATMTYSFAQQLPQLSSHTPPPPPHNPQSTPPDDPNFPKLTSKPVYSQTNRTGQTHPRAWDSMKRPHTPGRPPRWANGPGKPATAAEVVASAPSDNSSHSEEAAESEKQEAELALYSKLVPTTSAVPRNPGSLRGSGGLRATGSVAAQKSSRPSSGTGMHSQQSLPSLPRKEPMASRMRSLSSDTSKPQLARRVAKANRSASATPPPPPSVPSSTSSNASVDGMESETTIDDELEKAGLVALSSTVKKEDLVQVRNGSGEGISLSSTKHASFPITLRGQSDLREPRAMSTLPRRLDEAFLSRSRTENGTGSGMVNGRKPFLATSRRSSALSPPPGHRKGSGKDGSGRNEGRIEKETSQASVPPGFESRPTVSRNSLPRSRNVRSETDSVDPSRMFERGNPPMPPQNARADALRQALNARRRSNSPRTPHNSRHLQGQGDSISGTSGSEPTASAYNGLKKRSERELLRAGVTGDDFNRRSRTSSSRELDVALSTSDTSRQRRFATGHAGRHREASDRRGGASSAGPSTQGISKLHSVGLGKEQRLGTPDHPSSTSHLAETRASVKDAVKASLHPNMRDIRNYTGHMSNDEGDHKSVPSVPPLQGRYPTTYENGASGSYYAQEQRNSWRSTVDEISVAKSGRELFANNTFEGGCDDTARFSQSSSVTNGERNISSSGLSLVDAMTGFRTAGEAVTKHTGDGMDDVVLPPLPNSEDVAFESMLRSMGWTPLDEDDGPKHYQHHNERIAKLTESNGLCRDELSGPNSAHGTDVTENRNAGKGYYSHFQ